MSARKPKTDRHVEQILEVLRQNYLPDHPKARIDAYRYDDACVRIRILDPDYAGTKLEERWKQLRRLLEPLPEETRSDVGLMFLLTPKEAANRYKQMNGEFEDHMPKPAPLDQNGKPGSRNGRRTGSRKRAGSGTTRRSTAS